MKSRSQRRCVLAFSIVLVTQLAGCPEEDQLSPREACESVAATLCERIYACLSPAELARGGFPTTEGACVTELEDAQGCRAQTAANACDGNARYHGDRAATCVDQLADASCSQLRSGLDLDEVAPACAAVCEVD